MIIHVRTTLVLEDRLLRAAKRRAASRGITLSALVAEALRDALAEPTPSRTAARFEMLTYGRRAGRAHKEPRDFAAELEREDRARVGR